MKEKLIALGIIIFIALGLAWAVLYGPLFPFKAKDVEVLRLDSPDGKLDAVYIQRDAGAMTIAHHLIYIVPDGQKPSKKDTEIFCGKRVFDLKYFWEKDCNLKIQYSKADILHFRNYYFPFLKDIKYEVRIFEERIGEK